MIDSFARLSTAHGGRDAIGPGIERGGFGRNVGAHNVG